MSSREHDPNTIRVHGMTLKNSVTDTKGTGTTHNNSYGKDGKPLCHCSTQSSFNRHFCCFITRFTVRFCNAENSAVILQMLEGLVPHSTVDRAIALHIQLNRMHSSWSRSTYLLCWTSVTNCIYNCRKWNFFIPNPNTPCIYRNVTLLQPWIFL